MNDEDPISKPLIEKYKELEDIVDNLLDIYARDESEAHYKKNYESDPQLRFRIIVNLLLNNVIKNFGVLELSELIGSLIKNNIDPSNMNEYVELLVMSLYSLQHIIDVMKDDKKRKEFLDKCEKIKNKQIIH